MSPSSAAKENYEQPTGDSAVSQLRDEYRQIVDKKAQEKSLLPKDREACLKWLEQDSESRDPQALKMRIDHLKSSGVDQKIKDQRDQYLKELEPRAKSGLIREETMQERLDWFLNKLSFQEREEILKTKDGKKDDLFNKDRVEVFNQFKDLYKYFSYLPLHKKFAGLELDDRKKMVAELKAKKGLLTGGVLPTIVREKLKAECADSDLDTCKKLVAEAQMKHNAQKERFRKLPRPVQKEYMEKFKDLLLPARQSLLADIEQKIGRYSEQYRAQIKEKQRPDSDGLTLFSNVPEDVPASSSKRYMDWFSRELNIKEMGDAVSNSDLNNPERKQRCEEMKAILKTLPPKDKSSAISEFNKADLERRREIIARYPNVEKGASSAPASAEKKGFIQRMIRRIAGSSNHADIEQKIEAFGIGNEIAERRKRYQISHGDRENLNAKAAERGQTETVKRTQKLENAIHSEHLKEKETGGVKIRMDTLETYQGERHALRRALKVDLDNPNAQLAGDIHLKTRTGDVINDAREYQRGELKRQLTTVEQSMENAVAAEAALQGETIDKKAIQEELKKTDWKNLAKETIRRAA